MTRIALLRHFPTVWNAEGRLQGRTDVPLSPEGRCALAGFRLPAPFAGWPMIASPLRRAAETAASLAEGRPVPVDARLAEMDFGRWEGLTVAALEAEPGWRPIEAWGWDFRAPGGESPREMAARVRPLLAELAALGPRLLVTHRGLMRCLLAQASGWDYLGPMPFRIRRAAIHEIEVDPDGRPVGIAATVKLAVR